METKETKEKVKKVKNQNRYFDKANKYMFKNVRR